MFYMRTYVHLREHLELNSHIMYSIFIRVKNVLMKPFRVNWSRLSMTSTLFLLCFVVARIILKKWVNVPHYCMCVFSNFLCVVVILLLPCVRYTASHDVQQWFNVSIQHTYCHKIFWYYSYITWLNRKNINYRNHFCPLLYC